MRGTRTLGWTGSEEWWIKTGGTTTRGPHIARTGSSTGMTRAETRVFKNNTVVSALSELYHQNSSSSGDDATAYDSINRLVGFARGALSASSHNGGVLDTVASPSTSSKWNLDTLGNWVGDGSSSTSTTIAGVKLNRGYNCKNELTAAQSATLAFDNNGNTTADQNGNTYVYDVWNRCVIVKNSGGTTIASYSYDPHGWRVAESHGSTTTNCYFSKDWQVLEERQGTTVEDQYVWSLAYVDGLVLRDDQFTGGGYRRLYVQQDANWNVTAVTDDNATMLERFVYDPYGNVTVLNAAGTSAVTDAYDWMYLHQGGRLDPVTGLYNFDHRDYGPGLGRWYEQDPIGCIAMMTAVTDAYRWQYLHQGARLDAATNNYIFRHRDVLPMLGRWAEQEPFGAKYVDGMNLYLFESSNPATKLDPLGLYDINDCEHDCDQVAKKLPQGMRAAYLNGCYKCCGEAGTSKEMQDCAKKPHCDGGVGIEPPPEPPEMAAPGAAR